MKTPRFPLAILTLATAFAGAADDAPAAATVSARPAGEADESALIGTRMEGVFRAAQARHKDGFEAMCAEFERGARQLLRDFPQRPEPFELIVKLASACEEPRACVLIHEVLASSASAETKDSARAMLKKLAAVGRPVALKFTALDGRAVDLAALKGKVVLLDFWATWCPPCVAELPRLKELHERLGARGLEIISLSLDEDTAAVKRFVAKEKLAWRQGCDGLGWKSEVVQRLGLTSLPAMLLVDKTGRVRYVAAQSDLAGKVAELIAE